MRALLLLLVLLLPGCSPNDIPPPPEVEETAAAPSAVPAPAPLGTATSTVTGTLQSIEGEVVVVLAEGGGEPARLSFAEFSSYLPEGRIRSDFTPGSQVVVTVLESPGKREIQSIELVGASSPPAEAPSPAGEGADG